MGCQRFAVEVVSKQRRDKIRHDIYYAIRTSTDARLKYATTEKELLAVVFVFDKFRSYLIMSTMIVYMDHEAVTYMLSREDAIMRLIRWFLRVYKFDKEIQDKKTVKMW